MSYPAVNPRILRLVNVAMQEAEANPHMRSAILGQAALKVAAASQHPHHQKEAPALRLLAERVAEAAMVEPVIGSATLDDFEELLQERNIAHEEFSSDLDVRARSKQLHDARVAEHGPRVSIAPLSWGKGATLGRAGTFCFDPNQEQIAQGIKQSATLAYWQGEPHEPQAITVDLALPATDEPKAVAQLPDEDRSSRPHGIVSYGSDGAITQVKFDAGFGARLTVVGSYVAIVAGMDPPYRGVRSGVMSYTCSIGAFAAPTTAPLFLTHYVDQLANGETSPPITRPMHATAILPILSDQIGGNVVLTFYGQGGFGTLTRFSYPIGQLLQPIPIPSEVYYLTLSNTTGNDGNFRVPFQLSL